MIVNSRNLVLTEQALGYDPDYPIIGYDNLVTVDTLAADTEDEDFPASNLANAATDQFWRAGDVTEQYITVTVDANREVDYVAIVRHNFFSAGIVSSIEIQPTEGADWEEAVGEQMLAGNEAVIYRFEKQIVYAVRLKMSAPPGSPPVPAEIAVMYVGALMTFPRSLAFEEFTPLVDAIQVDASIGFTENGNVGGRIILAQRLQTQVPFKFLDGDWYREYFRPFVDRAIVAPFFFSYRPLTFPDEVGFCWLTSIPQPRVDPETKDIHVVLDISGLLL